MGEQGPKYRLTIKRGDPCSGYFAIYDGVKANGLKDLTGYTGKMQVRATEDSETIALEFFVEIGAFSPTKIDGTVYPCNVRYEATHTQTAALKNWGLGVWDLQITDPFGRPWTTRDGVAVLEKDVSR